MYIIPVGKSLHKIVMSKIKLYVNIFEQEMWSKKFFTC
jgi:hypothetical protein